MAKYADWYSIELNGFLKGRMSDVDRFESIKEINSHIAEHVEELVDKGMDAVEAERSAIAAFGPPRQAALNLLKTGRWDKVGSFFAWLACIALPFTIVLGGMLAQSAIMSNFLGLLAKVRFVYVEGALWGCIMGGLVLASLLSKRVYAKRVFVSGALGVVALTGYLVFGPQPEFANVPHDKLITTEIPKWREGLRATQSLLTIQRKMTQHMSPLGRYGDRTPLDKEAIKKDLLENAPKLLAVKPVYLVTRGTETAGFLAPYQRPYSQRIATAEDEDFVPTTGRIFPYELQEYSYYKTLDEAIGAWQSFYGRYYSEYDSELSIMVSRQRDFLRQADSISRMSRGQVIATIMVPLTGFVFAALLILCGGSWLLTKIPNFTFHSSFRRRLA